MTNKPDIEGMQARVAAATHFAFDAEGNLYLPMTGRNGTDLLPVSRRNIPMSKFDLDFYCEAKRDIPQLIACVLEQQQCIEMLEKDCVLALNAFEKNWAIDWSEISNDLAKLADLKKRWAEK